MDVLEYKGYVTKVHYDAKAHLLYGKVQGIVDAVNYESTTIEGVEAAFHDSVDRYLDFCSAVKRRPAKGFQRTVQRAFETSAPQSHGSLSDGTPYHVKHRHGRSRMHISSTSGSSKQPGLSHRS